VNLLSLDRVLRAMHFSRLKLVLSFLNEDIELYTSFYELKSGSHSMDVALKLYYLKWVSSHPRYFSELFSDSQVDNVTLKGLYVAWQALCESLLNDAIDRVASEGAISHESLSIYIDGLQGLQDLSVKADFNLAKMKLHAMKNKSNFEYEYNKLLERIYE